MYQWPADGGLAEYRLGLDRLADSDKHVKFGSSKQAAKPVGAEPLALSARQNGDRVE
jgi:hypothetical protein